MIDYYQRRDSKFFRERGRFSTLCGHVNINQELVVCLLVLLQCLFKFLIYCGKFDESLRMLHNYLN